jgi:hypothetical protein
MVKQCIFPAVILKMGSGKKINSAAVALGFFMDK